MNQCSCVVGVTAFVLLLVANAPGNAALISIANPSFESPALADGVNTLGTSGTTAVPGWTIIGGPVGVWNPPVSGYSVPLPDGVQIVGSNGGTIQQILAAALTADTTYTLQVAIGHRNNYPFPGYQVGLYAGGTLLVQDNTSLMPTQNSFLTTTLTYQALPGNPLLGQLLEIRLRANGDQVNFDNVRLDASPSPVSAVSEPGTVLLWTFAGLGLATSAVRRRFARSRLPLSLLASATHF